MQKTLLMPKDNADDKVNVSKHYMKAGDKTYIHWHDYYEMEIVLSGTATHIYNGKSISVSRGDAYLMTYYDFHSLSAVTDVELLHVSFSEDIVPSDLATHISSLPGSFHCRFSETETLFMEQRHERLKCETEQVLPFSDQAVDSILTEMLITLMRKSAPQSEKKPQQMQLAVAYIYKHFRGNLLLSDLALHLGLSPNYCGNLFSKTFGISFNDYLLQVRLKYACKMLSSTAISVSKIALASGFHTVEYFFLSFKKRIGITPTAYRHETQNA